ncbi:MAG: RtcB family protein [Clostridia bacterium]|nr:RtcB family protein [Clostridia bacterium]
MIKVEGLFNNALCYTDKLEDSAAEQIKMFCDREKFKDCLIRIMPDVHSGKGCTIGTTMTIKDKVVPNMVGVDIGCGMETVLISQKEIDFDKLDKIIRRNVPSGFNVRGIPHRYNEEIQLDKLRCIDHIDKERAVHSLGSLGGGNHFIEIDRDSMERLYLVVHSGSRHLGVEVAQFYQEEGFKALYGGLDVQVEELIKRLKAEGRETEIEAQVKKIRASINAARKEQEFAYVEGKLFDDYIHDMKIVQQFATLNRKAIVDVIFRGMGFTELERFTTIHNYIDTEEMMLRKGAVSAKKGEKLLIPINMRDGSIVCIGKGNAEWNFSAPHGAGRLMSRKQARCNLDMKEYEKQMEGIYSTCVLPDTIDESPMAYKSMDNILSQIEPTCEVVDIIKPIYNFKASE